MVNQHLKDLDKHHTTIIRIMEGVGALGALVIGKSPALAGEIIQGGETVNTAWDEIDDVVGQVKDTANHAQSVYGAGSRQMQQIKQKVALINSTVETHNQQHLPIMSNKNRKTSGGTVLGLGPSSTPRQTPVVTHTSLAKGIAKREARNRQQEGYSIKTPKTPANCIRILP